MVSVSLLVVTAGSATGLDRAQSLHQSNHEKWNAPEILGGVTAIAQTPDGYLWLGTARGLVRFDGVRFSAWTLASGESLPHPSVYSLRLARSGALWIGTRSGVARLEQSRLTAFGPTEGLPRGTAVSILEDRNGGIWVGVVGANGGGLAAIGDGSVRAFGTAEGLASPQVFSLFEDRHGVIWAGTDAGLCRVSAEGEGSCLGGGRQILSITDEAGGALLVGDGWSRGLLRLPLLSNKLARFATEASSFTPRTLLRDRNGNLWIGTFGQGLFRLRQGHMEQFTQRNGLSSNLVQALFEDQEGNIWVGTTGGLDRFRNSIFMRVSTAEGLSAAAVTAVCATRDGAAWVGTAGRGLNHVNRDRVTVYETSSGLPGPTVLSLYEDASGNLWVGTTGGLAVRSHGHFAELRDEAGPFDRVFAIAGGRDDSLWIADDKRGLFHLAPGDRRPQPVKGLPAGRNPYQLWHDSMDRLWVGFYEGGVVALTAEGGRRHEPGEGLAGGTVHAIYEDEGGTIWVGTEEGLSRFRAGRWTTWTAEHGVPVGGIQGIIADRASGLWLTSPAGVRRASLAILSATPDGSPGKIEFKYYGPSEGVHVAPRGKTANPQMARSADGRLWIATEDGVAVINPKHAITSTPPPPVAIERIVADGAAIDASAEPAFRARQVHFDYTALQLANPAAVRFRYKLEGLDADWIEAGGRREVTYTNLSPGSYRFRVTARSGDGVWNQADAAVAFRISPYFHQTQLFMALCAVLTALGFWGLDRFRVWRLHARFRLVLEERARVTRELHDTVLQGFVGVVYQLEAALRHFDTAPNISRGRLERAVKTAEAALRDGREAITNLRLPTLDAKALPGVISDIGSEVTAGTPVRFSLQVKGTPTLLSHEVEANVAVIAREAIWNAVTHARPGSVSVRLEYSPDRLTLTVQDDGSGFDTKTAGDRQNRFGLVGMRERAKEIRAEFRIDSEIGRGSTIELTTPVQRLVRKALTR